jgi:hypothetical protein
MLFVQILATFPSICVNSISLCVPSHSVLFKPIYLKFQTAENVKHNSSSEMQLCLRHGKLQQDRVGISCNRDRLSAVHANMI